MFDNNVECSDYMLENDFVVAKIVSLYCREFELSYDIHFAINFRSAARLSALQAKFFLELQSNSDNLQLSNLFLQSYLLVMHSF